MKFYKKYDQDENLAFDQDEMITVMEAFTSEQLLGKKKMKKLLKSTGVDFNFKMMGIKNVFQTGI